MLKSNQNTRSQESVQRLGHHLEQQGQTGGHLLYRNDQFQQPQALVCDQSPSQLGIDGVQQDHSAATLEVYADPESAVGEFS